MSSAVERDDLSGSVVGSSLDRPIQVLFVGLVIFMPLAYGAVEVWSITVFHLVSIIIGLLWALPMIYRGRVSLYRSALDLPILVVLAFAVLSSALSVDPYASRIDLYKLFNYALIYFLLVQTLRARCRYLPLIWAIVLFGGIYTFAAMLVADQTLPMIKTFSRGIYGISFTFVNQNHFAGFLGMIVWLGVGLALAYRGALRILVLTLSLLTAVALVFSLSRGGLLGLIVGFSCLLLMLLGSRADRRKSTALMAFAILGGSSVVVLEGATAFQDLLNALDAPQVAGKVRLAIWSGTCLMIAANPWLGTGPGTYMHAFSRYQPQETAGKVVNHAHNDYLELAAEIGLPGLLAALWCIAALLSSAIAGLREQPIHRLRVVGMGALCGCVSLLTHSLVEFNFHIPANAFLLVVCAAIAASAGAKRHGDRFWIRIDRRYRVLVGGAVVAMSTLAGVTVLAPYVGSLYAQRASDARRHGELEAARESLENATFWARGHAGFLARVGDLLRQQSGSRSGAGREALLAEALAYYRMAQQACPVNGYNYTREASVLSSLSRSEVAVQAYETAARLAPMSTFTHYDLGTAYLKQQKTTEGLAEIRRFLELDEVYLVTILDQLWEAAHDVATLRRVVPDSPQARRVFADYLLDKGEIQHALQERAFAFLLEPTRESALIHLRSLPQDLTTLALARRYLELFPGDGRLRQETARIYAGLGSFKNAIEILESMIAEDSADADVSMLLASCYRRDGRLQDAAEVLRKTLERQPENVALYVSLAGVYRASARPVEEMQVLKKAILLQPDNAQHRHGLGQAYFRQGMFQEAAREWRACVRIEPTNVQCGENLRRLLKQLDLEG